MFNTERVRILTNEEFISNNFVSYHKDLLGVENLYKQGITGKGLVCAVLDSGCDKNHPMLKNKIIGGKNFTKEGGVNDFTDFNGHGTHVAGIISSDPYGPFKGGVAPDAKLLICKVLTRDGSGDVYGIINAIKYAIDKKVNVINMSLGTSYNDPLLYNIVKQAYDAGIVICCASGNEANGDNGKVDEFCYPGAYQEVIEVGSINQDKIPSYFSNSNHLIDCVGYGENILSTFPNNRFCLMDGTSQATPVITGCVLLLKQWFMKEFKREPSKDEIYATLIKCSITMENYSRKQTGFGFIDLNKI